MLILQGCGNKQIHLYIQWLQPERYLLFDLVFASVHIVSLRVNIAAYKVRVLLDGTTRGQS